MIYSTSIGLDVHARTVCASALVHETGELVRSSFGYDPAPTAGLASSCERCNERLNRRFAALRARGKHGSVIAAAVARELAGFVWAIGSEAQ